MALVNSDELYAAFRKAPAPKTIFGCPCCVDSALVKRLESCIPRNLEAPDLKILGRKVMTTILFPKKENFQYFAARLLEYEYQEGYHGLHVIFGKFKLADFSLWPQERKDAIKNYILSISKAHLKSADTSWRFEETLTDAHLLFDDISFLLELMDAEIEKKSETATLVLQMFERTVWEEHEDKRLHPKLVKWLQREVCKNLLLETYSKPE